MNITSSAVIGSGVIGSGWIARLLLNGIDVVVFDPAENAVDRVAEVVKNAQRANNRLTTIPLPKQGTLSFASSINEAVNEAGIIFEAVPERLSIKQEVFAEIECTAPDHAIIASSTSGIMPSDLQAKMQIPARLIVAHPFNPVYLLPLVELVGGDKTDDAMIQQATVFFTRLGMYPLHVRNEIPAFIADRFLEAVWREALWMINDGIATTKEIDDAIRYGFGLRWAQMGLFETFRIAGGEAGMRHFMAQFGPCLKWPWTHLTDVPELTDELVDEVTRLSDEQSGHLSIRQLEQIRDDNLVVILRALKTNRWGAGKTLLDYEAELSRQASATDSGISHDQGIDFSQTLPTLNKRIPPEWTDYNGHMNETHYLECFSNATDEFMVIIGADEAYISSGKSYFTVETHICHVDEVVAGERIFATTQLLNGAGKKMHLYHELFHESGRLLATGEHMLIHVDLNNRRASEPGKEVADCLDNIYACHGKMDIPANVGRAIGKK